MYNVEWDTGAWCKRLGGRVWVWQDRLPGHHTQARTDGQVVRKCHRENTPLPAEGL